MERKLGNYTIQGEIGRGGMATVYRALQESLNRVVALKELDLSRIRSEPNALERFRLEARAAAALKHPNIVTIYDLWEEEGKAYIAMELVDGVELADALLNLGSIPYLNAVLIAMAVAEALQYAHGSGMIHRDVKPANIMLSSGGDIRLMDFGIVSVAGAGDLTVAGQILGTPAYMSPEQIAGEKPGPGTDLFSLGAVLYEMIAGRKPFTGVNHVALIQDVLHGQPVPLHELDPQVPESISRAVARCLEKSLGNRYGSAEEFSTVLEMVMPLERPNRTTVVTQLVKDTVEQERTRLTTSAGEDDRTSPMMAAPGPRADTGGEAPLIPDSTAAHYQLEQDPPADLPPLDPEGGKPVSSESRDPVSDTTPAPLTMKGVPELEEDTGKYIEETGKRKKKRSKLWLIPVILLLAVVALRLAGGRPGKLLKKAVSPPTKAHITVTADPAGRVFMDGELIGNARPSLALDVKPGLHRLTVRHPKFGSKKFIVELDPGERKEIEVKFEN